MDEGAGRLRPRSTSTNFRASRKFNAKSKQWNEFQTSKYFSLEYRQGTYFALKLQPPKNQAIL